MSVVPVPRSMADALVAGLRAAIIDGEFCPGDRLTIDTVAARFETSATPVRTALVQLNAEGLVKMEAHRGAIVAELGPDEITDVFDVRLHLEGLATRLSVPRMNREQVDELDRIATEMSERGDLPTIIALNNTFHLHLYEPCGRPYLLRLIEQSRLRVQHYMRWFTMDGERLRSAEDEHHGIVEACREGDTELAATLVEDHIRAAIPHIVAGARGLAEERERKA